MKWGSPILREEKKGKKVTRNGGKLYIMFDWTPRGVSSFYHIKTFVCIEIYVFK
jgi:hypothetical protein